MPFRRSVKPGAIDWRDAVFGGACLGGLMWATITYLAMGASDHRPYFVMNWPIVAAVCIPLIVVGSAVGRWASTRALRTAGLAAVIAPLTAPPVMLGFLTLGVIFG
jgi:prolipoprotein diacylglyceryltransferase